MVQQVGLLPYVFAQSTLKATGTMLQMLAIYGKRRSGKAHAPAIDPKVLRRLSCSSLLNFNRPFLDFLPILALRSGTFLLCNLAFHTFPFSSSLELELKRVTKSTNQRPAFTNSTSTYFILLLNNIFLFCGCSTEEAEQQHLEQLLILPITITY